MDQISCLMARHAIVVCWFVIMFCGETKKKDGGKLT